MTFRKLLARFIFANPIVHLVIACLALAGVGALVLFN